MPSYRSSSRATNLLQHQRTRGRSYPTPRYWERLYQMLEEEAEKRGKTPPPPPLTHGLEHELTEEDRVERLREQVSAGEAQLADVERLSEILTAKAAPADKE